jgi:hypothetical protein
MAQYGAGSYVGRASANNVILQASQTVVADGTGTAIGDFGEFSVAMFQIDVTAAAAGSGDRLDVYVQTTIDGSLWFDVAHNTQHTGLSGVKRYLSKISANLAEAEFQAAGTLAGGAVRNILGNQYRVRWVVTDGGGPSFTFSVKVNFLS